MWNRYGSCQGGPWDGRSKLLCCRWLSPFLKLVWKGLPSPFYTSLREGDSHLQHNSFDLPSHGLPWHEAYLFHMKPFYTSSREGDNHLNTIVLTCHPMVQSDTSHISFTWSPFYTSLREGDNHLNTIVLTCHPMAHPHMNHISFTWSPSTQA